jgi:tetratricopeptide (TPR) repeat protein
VLRLLTWPARLASDYSPQTIPLRETWTPVATLALVTSLALLALAWLVRRRAPAVTFGVLAGAATYLPTANLLFTSGIVLAERTLYLAVLAPALTVGWLVMRFWETPYRSRVLAAAAVACAALAMRSVQREPFWRDTRTVIIDRAVGHPENAFAQYRLADALLKSGDSSRALAQYLTAYELYGRYSLIPERASELALGLGRWRLARELGRRAFAISPADPTIAGSLVHVFFALHEPDSALAVAREALSRNPLNLQMLAVYERTLERAGRPQRVVQLARARLDGLAGQFVSATAIIDSLGLEHRGAIEPGECFDLRESLAMLRLLAAADTLAAQRLVGNCGKSVAILSR